MNTLQHGKFDGDMFLGKRIFMGKRDLSYTALRIPSFSMFFFVSRKDLLGQKVAAVSAHHLGEFPKKLSTKYSKRGAAQRCIAKTYL